MSNRVEELERTVSELQAAVNGLTEELVETKERLREIESAQAAESNRGAGGRSNRGSSGDSATEDQPETEAAHTQILEPRGGNDMDAGPEGGAGDDAEATGSDAGEAGDGADEPADNQSEKSDDDIKTEGDEDADDGGSDESDIIVA